VANGTAAAHEQAATIAAEIVAQGGPDGLADKKIVALIAYLQRLGTDISKAPPVAVEEQAVPAQAAAADGEPVVVGEAP
jgi:cytochrome c oxidase cbb3-type subunit I/II